ncbi:MAG: glycosyltransferase family 2 protein [Promethearchaeota archaeon]
MEKMYYSSMKLSLIIPCYQEDQTINKVLQLIKKQEFPVEYEILLIDDGSEIPVVDVIDGLTNKLNLRIYRFRSNQGKGCAVRLGVAKARGDYVLIQDADLEYLPKDIPRLLEPVLEKNAPVVYGSRFLNKPEHIRMSHNFGNKMLNIVSNFLFHSNLTDFETGYKLIKRSLLLDMDLQSREFELEPEITAKLLKRGIPIIEVPIFYRYRAKGHAKISYLDGIEAIIQLLKERIFEKSTFMNWILLIYKFHLKKILQKIRNKLFSFRRF